MHMLVAAIAAAALQVFEGRKTGHQTRYFGFTLNGLNSKNNTY